MPYFMTKMRQVRFRLGLCPRSRWESSQRSPRPANWIWGVLLLRKGEGMGEKGREGTGKKGSRGKEGRRMDATGTKGCFFEKFPRFSAITHADHANEYFVGFSGALRLSLASLNILYSSWRSPHWICIVTDGQGRASFHATSATVVEFAGIRSYFRWG